MGRDFFLLLSKGEGLVSAGFKGGMTGFRVGRTGFGWFRLIPLFSNYLLLFFLPLTLVINIFNHHLYIYIYILITLILLNLVSLSFIFLAL